MYNTNIMSTLEQDAQKLNTLLVDLIKRYQFRDRSQICCHGLSVSQCYALMTIKDQGLLAMRELAAKLYLTISTMTRIVEQLVKKKLVHRRPDPKDRRMVLVEVTEAGEGVLKEIKEVMLSSQKEILSKLSPQEREVLIKAISELAQAVEAWQCECAV